MPIQDIIRDSFASFMTGLGEFLPNILAALVILLVGWIVAKVLKAAVVRMLKLIKFPVLAEKAGIDEFLAKGGVTHSAAGLLGVLVYWLLMLIVLLMAVNALRLEMASQMLNQILLYVPNVIVAVIVLVVGLSAANFVAGLVRTAAANAGIEEAPLLAAVARYALIVFAFVIALSQLRIGEGIVANGFLILFGAACLAAALAVGLGGRETISRYLNRRFGDS